MNYHTLTLDIAYILVMVGMYALGHFHGWTDYARALRGGGIVGRRTWRWQYAVALAVFVGLLLRWAGVGA